MPNAELHGFAVGLLQSDECLALRLNVYARPAALCYLPLTTERSESIVPAYLLTIYVQDLVSIR